MDHQKIIAENKWRVLDAAMHSPNLRYASKVVFFTIVSYFNFENQYVYYHSEDQIAEDAGSTRRTVISSIKELEEGNWIKVERRKRHNNFYKINWKKVDVKDLHIKVDVKDLPVDVKDLPVDVKDLPVDVKETAHKQVTSNK